MKIGDAHFGSRAASESGPHHREWPSGRDTAPSGQELTGSTVAKGAPAPRVEGRPGYGKTTAVSELSWKFVKRADDVYRGQRRRQDDAAEGDLRAVGPPRPACLQGEDITGLAGCILEPRIAHCPEGRRAFGHDGDREFADGMPPAPRFRRSGRHGQALRPLSDSSTIAARKWPADAVCGEQQMLAIARAHVGWKLVMFDEPLLLPPTSSIALRGDQGHPGGGATVIRVQQTPSPPLNCRTDPT